MSIIDKQIVCGKMTMGGKRGNDGMHLILDIPTNQFREYGEFTTDKGVISAGSSFSVGKERKIPVVIDGVTYNVYVSISKANESNRTAVSDVL